MVVRLCMRNHGTALWRGEIYLPLTRNVPTGSGNKCLIQWALHEGKKRPERGIDISPPSSVEVKNEYCYISAPLMPSWCKERQFVVRWRRVITVGLMGEFTLWWVSGCRQQTAVWEMEGQGSLAEFRSRTALWNFNVRFTHSMPCPCRSTVMLCR
jgi:hypothetical protein